jgi:hypothetical protein
VSSGERRQLPPVHALVDDWALFLPHRCDAWEIAVGSRAEVLAASLAFRAELDRAIKMLEQGAEQSVAAGPVLTSSDPQPPVGTLVRDDGGFRWVNSGLRPCAWESADFDSAPVSWTKVAGNYGPVTVTEWGDGQ